MKSVSRCGGFFLVLFLLQSSFDLLAQPPSSGKTAIAAADSAGDPQKLFEAGEVALRAGKLDEAQSDFQAVLAIHPREAGAYTNLGVIHMRRKQWAQALDTLHTAEQLAPDMAGVRLNIGLVYYRQHNFHAAIAPFESVLKQMPSSYQARYLLGFCYFFDAQWAETISTLEPLWDQVPPPDQLNYLYVLGRAAELSRNSALEEKSYARMAEIGQGSPEFRMIIGKAHLNRGEYDDAFSDLEAAAKSDPRLPLVHYYLGMTYARRQDYRRAQVEFQKDLEIEPDAPYTYEELGKVESALQEEGQ